MSAADLPPIDDLADAIAAGRTAQGAKPINLQPRHVELFWAKVEKGSPDECWTWTAYRKPSGYGSFSAGSKNYPAHRVAYTLLVGPVDSHLDLDHLCRNRACVNPHHLEPVTRKENLRRGAGTASRTVCPQGHPYTPDNTYRERDGSRKCRTCVLRRVRRYYQKVRRAA